MSPDSGVMGNAIRSNKTVTFAKCESSKVLFLFRLEDISLITMCRRVHYFTGNKSNTLEEGVLGIYLASRTTAWLLHLNHSFAMDEDT